MSTTPLPQDPTTPQAGQLDAAGQGVMAAALLQRLRAAHSDGDVVLIETHISFVLVGPDRAVKIKKAVNLGFVDFTTLALRRHFCDEELRLNRRLAPDLYLGVLPITGTPERPTLAGDGPVIDWAVDMRSFAQDGLWERLARRGALQPRHIDELVEVLVPFHQAAAVAQPAAGFGAAQQVRAPMLDTLSALQGQCRTASEQAALQRLVQWEAQAFDALRGCFEQRLHDGRVRECHGDLHLGNVTVIDGRTTVFDCLEFSPELRWTDVMCDVAFMAMDLHRHGLHRLSHRFVNAYVERSGDHDGLRVLRYYQVYRALVRAKVSALRGAQQGGALPATPPATDDDGLRAYLDVALACSHPPASALFMTHGFSGSGKSAATQGLLELCGAIRVRADVERKRLFGMPALARSDVEQKQRLYSPELGAATQARLRDLAALALASGYPVILDATFLAREQREQARALARTMGVPCVLIDFRASRDTLRARVARRALGHDDPSEADVSVLEGQFARAEALAPDELAEVFAFDSEQALDAADDGDRWAGLLQRLVVPAR